LRLGYVKLELEEEEMEKVEVEITVEKMVRKDRYRKSYVNVPQYISFFIGGINILVIGPSENPPHNKPIWTWPDKFPVILKIVENDSTVMRSLSSSSYNERIEYHTSQYVFEPEYKRIQKKKRQNLIVLFDENKEFGEHYKIYITTTKIKK
jgi:hypothetical protein